MKVFGKEYSRGNGRTKTLRWGGALAGLRERKVGGRSLVKEREMAEV